MQSLQLICSLTPSRTVPSTRLVIIWLKRCCASVLIDPALEPPSVGGVGAGGGGGGGVGAGVGGGVGHGPSQNSCADAGFVCAAISISVTAAANAADTMAPRVNFAIISARTTCRWGRCRHRQAWHPRNS